MHVANMSLLLNPARIAVGGGMMRSPERVLRPLRERLARAVPFPPELVCARFLQDAAVRGAAALALELEPALER
jgi:glucokinase